jgi:hypothetical protein
MAAALQLHHHPAPRQVPANQQLSVRFGKRSTTIDVFEYRVATVSLLLCWM